MADPVNALLATLQGAFAEDALDAAFGPAREGLVHRSTALAADGAQLRAYGLGGGGVVMHVAPDGRVTFAQVDDAVHPAAEPLPERHPTPLAARSWGEAQAHARATGASVVGIRERGDVVQLVVEEPETPSREWVSQLGTDSPSPGVPTRRATRAYRIAARRVLDPAFMGDPSRPSLLSPEKWSLLGTSLVHPGRPIPPTDTDRRVTQAALHALRALVPPGADSVPEAAFSSRVGRMLRERAPERFTLAGIDRAIASLETA